MTLGRPIERDSLSTPMRAVWVLTLLVLLFACDAAAPTPDSEDGDYVLNGAIGSDPFVFFFAPHTINDPRNPDADGIPRQAIDTDLHYNPVSIAQRALAYSRRYAATGSGSDAEEFLVLADWLLENAEDRGGYAVWTYAFDYPAFGAVAPWVSAMAQGLALPVMLQAYLLTDDVLYLNLAERAMRAFAHPVSDGGVTRATSAGPWFEEYGGTFPSQVLNGKIFALAGLLHYGHFADSEMAFDLWTAGSRTLRDSLAEYDSGFWSNYALAAVPPSPANPVYHLLHIEQLLWMAAATGDSLYTTYAHRFAQYCSAAHAIREHDLSSIQDIDASYSIDPIDHGPPQMANGKWSYGAYWSADRYPVTVEIDFGSIVSDLQSVILFFVTDVSEMSFSIEIAEDSMSGFTPLYSGPRDWNPQINTSVTVSGPGATTTFVQRMSIDTDGRPARYLRMTLHTSPSLVAIREINVIYDKSATIEAIAASLSLRTP